MMGIQVCVITDRGVWTSQEALDIESADVVLAYGGEQKYYVTEDIPVGQLSTGRTRAETKLPVQLPLPVRPSLPVPPLITRTASKAAAAAGSSEHTATSATQQIDDEREKAESEAAELEARRQVEVEERFDESERDEREAEREAERSELEPSELESSCEMIIHITKKKEVFVSPKQKTKKVLNNLVFSLSLSLS
jgi:hypothetical protein